MRIDEMNPHQYVRFLNGVHEGADLEQHLAVQFRGSEIAGLPFLELYKDCMTQSGTEVEGWKVLRRALRALNLGRYFHQALELDGEIVECGVLRGFSALMQGKIAAAKLPDFTGHGIHLVDSFDGLSAPTEPDALGYRPGENNTPEFVYASEKGDMYGPIDHVRQVLTDYPDMAFHQGWIPEVLTSLPETNWKFVHIDVDLYEPTMACLNYFMPRLISGGCIVNDDFSSPLFPGGGAAWQDYFEANKAPYVVLDSGQAVYLNS